MDEGVHGWKLGGKITRGQTESRIAVGVFAGVVLVIFQLRQNADLLELQILKQDVDSYIAGELMMIGENYADTWQKMVEEPENLNLAELRAIESHTQILNTQF